VWTEWRLRFLERTLRDFMEREFREGKPMPEPLDWTGSFQLWLSKPLPDGEAQVEVTSSKIWAAR
jgi:hypothetical protein